MITKQEFNDYEELRKSDKVNMWLIQDVCSKINLKKEQVYEIMENYYKLLKKYSPEQEKAVTSG